MSLSVRLLGSQAYFSIVLNVTAQKEYVYTKGTFISPKTCMIQNCMITCPVLDQTLCADGIQ